MKNQALIKNIQSAILKNLDDQERVELARGIPDSNDQTENMPLLSPQGPSTSTGSALGAGKRAASGVETLLKKAAAADAKVEKGGKVIALAGKVFEKAKAIGEVMEPAADVAEVFPDSLGIAVKCAKMLKYARRTKKTVNHILALEVLCCFAQEEYPDLMEGTADAIEFALAQKRAKRDTSINAIFPVRWIGTLRSLNRVGLKQTIEQSAKGKEPIREDMPSSMAMILWRNARAGDPLAKQAVFELTGNTDSNCAQIKGKMMSA